MTEKTPHICLITPSHVASAPRLVKSADALAEAGYAVHVISGAPFPPADALDSDILRGASWKHTRVNTRTGPAVRARKLARQFARYLIRFSGSDRLGIAARAQYAESFHLARAAAQIPAELYIGHSLSSLHVAATAASARSARFGFDIEDFHDAETNEAIADPVEARARSILQAALLPRCQPLTCSSPLIAQAYAQSYGVHPETVLNVFPRSMAPSEARIPMEITEERPAILYWFSQSIGHGRGLEEIIRIAGRMRTPVELHLRGFVTPGYSSLLGSLARNAGLKRPVRFLPPGPPGEMARLAAAADLGLSIEEKAPLNRDLCLTNKVFTYVTAEIPQLLSDTSAQRALAPELGDAGLLSDITRTVETASLLDSFFADPPRMARARIFARELARKRFCWDIEKGVLLRSVGRVLPPPP